MAETKRTRTTSRSVEQRFSAQTKAEGDCLVWTGLVDGWGYGLFWSGTRLMGAHRYAWEAERGPIPAGVELDHQCHNRTCCNLTHLRIATRKQITPRDIEALSGTSNPRNGVFK